MKPASKHLVPYIFLTSILTLGSCTEQEPVTPIDAALEDHAIVEDSSSTATVSCVSNAECPRSDWCRFIAGCGADGNVGLCALFPSDCGEECPGVCGCNGETYCTACEAAQAGTSVLREGDCEAPTFGSCVESQECADGQWCDLSSCESASGHCRPRLPETDCSTDGGLVCGCDGMSYPSSCHARAAGTNVASAGSCTD